MSVVPTTSDVAIWLRFQIAAGRFADTSDLPQMNVLARKLGVNVATISDAYDQLSNADSERQRLAAVPRGPGGFDVVADLVDQIVELDCFESELKTEF